MNKRPNRTLQILLTTIPMLLITQIAAPFSAATEKTKTEKKMHSEMPDCLKKLMEASSFDDDVRGESPRLSENYLAYQKASEILTDLSTDDLNQVLSHGSPAGRLYAAVLLTVQGRVGKNLTFEKLLADKSKVEYHSGCRGTSETVGEIARSLNDTGAYLNFKYSLFCKLKAPLVQTSPSMSAEKAFEILNSSTALVDFQQGDTNQPAGVWLAFQVLLKNGSASTSAAKNLLKSNSAAGKLYGAILLKQIDPTGFQTQLSSLMHDDTPVVRSQGCAREQASVKEFAARIQKGEQLVKMKNPNEI